MTGYMFAIGFCAGCRQSFGFNSELFPSLTINGRPPVDACSSPAIDRALARAELVRRLRAVEARGGVIAPELRQAVLL